MKIGIVNDLPMATEVLRRALALAPQHQIVWVAENGAEAIARCAENTPDLVLMDLIMPVMDGVEATRRIMANTPCAILIVTASVEANTSRVFEALGYGALDAVDTPALGVGDLAASAKPFLYKIGMIGKLVGDTPVPQSAVKPNGGRNGSRQHLVVIGASAGGPSALAVVLKGLPRDFPAAVVIVQHVDERFTSSLANWLGGQSTLPVQLAKEDDRLRPGTILIAGTGDHLAFKDSERLGYTPEPQDCPYRPSVNVFFESVGKLWLGKAIGVLLTGMGQDGATGLKTLRTKGHHTIAQDKASSAVYGMPKAAAAADAATDILPLTRIAPRLVELFCASDTS